MTSLFLAALLSNAAPATTPVAVDGAAPKVRCKRELETGTLAKFRKVCLSERDWAADRATAREAAQRMQDGAPPQTAF